MAAMNHSSDLRPFKSMWKVKILDPDVLSPIHNDLNFVYKHDTFKVLKIITNLGMINDFDATQSPTGSDVKFGGTFSTQSDAPEGSLTAHGELCYKISVYNKGQEREVQKVARVRLGII
ncbi:unnamed protein product [Brassica rapa]|uniref:Uncharacterized protein n=1 Tax=Brassica campestris TaxID=3711 RepID=A0A3P6B9Z7_BRACM|nr:unnamed protein product [Brassica rapa]VDC96044.1 unnamed protein product [Brassica rapa]